MDALNPWLGTPRLRPAVFRSIAVSFLIALTAGCSSAPPTLTRSAEFFCPARAMVVLPDATTRPSFEAGVTRNHLIPEAAEFFTLRQLGRRLESVLLQAGYRSVAFFGYRCSGFALVPDLERIERNGQPFEGTSRFAPPGPVDRFDVEEVKQRLHFAPNGTYRQMVVIVEDDPNSEPATVPGVGDLQARVATGQSSLPFGFDDVLFGEAYKVRVLVYELKKGPGDREVQIVDRFDGPEGPRHLTASGLYEALRSPPELETPVAPDVDL